MFQNYSFKKILYLSGFLLIVPYNSQTYSLPELDNITKQHKKEGNIENAIKLNIQSLKHFETQNNNEGMVTAYINLGNLLCSLNKYKESIQYLDKAGDKLKEMKNKPILQSKLYNEYGRNYALLGLFDHSNKTLNKAIQFTQKIPDLKQKNEQLYYSYGWKWYNFDHLKKADSADVIKRKSLQLSSEPLVLTRVAYEFIKEGVHLDSAKYYLDKALASTDKYSLEQKGITLMYYGDYYLEKKNNEKALDYFLQALAVFEKTKNKEQMRVVYDYLSYTYKSLNNTEKATEYSEKHSAVIEALKENNEEAVNIAVERLAQEKHEEETQKRNKLYGLVFFIIASALIIIYFIRKVYLKKQKHKDEIIEVKSKEADQLKKKVNLSFDEVTQLAKTKDPFFLARFKEVYPEFYNTLISQYPNLSDHDLRYCAYMRLNIPTSNIIEFENIGKRSVETKMYRLKKKLEVNTEIDDLRKWIAEL